MPNNDARKYISIEELARASGASEITLRRLWKTRKIPGFQPGGPNSRIFFPPNAIEVGAAVAAQSVAPEQPQASSDPILSDAKNKSGTSGTRPARARWRRRALAMNNEGTS